MAKQIDFDPIRSAVMSLFGPIRRGRPPWTIWLAGASDCDKLRFWVSLTDVVIAFADPGVLRAIARYVNEAETKANRELVKKMNEQTIAFNDAAKQCRLGGIPVSHPDLR